MYEHQAQGGQRFDLITALTKMTEKPFQNDFRRKVHLLRPKSTPTEKLMSPMRLLYDDELYTCMAYIY